MREVNETNICKHKYYIYASSELCYTDIWSIGFVRRDSFPTLSLYSKHFEKSVYDGVIAVPMKLP